MATNISVARMPPAVTHVIGTLFKFTSDTKEHIVKSFIGVMDEHVICEYDDDFFVLRCLRYNDAIPEKFSQHLWDFIRSEQQRKLDVFEDARLLPIDGTVIKPEESRPMMTQLLGVGVSDESVGETLSNPSRNPSLSLENDTLLIDYDSVTQKWTPGLTDGLVYSSSRDQTLARIGAISNCRIDYLDSADFVIKGDKQEDIDKAISKLERLDGIARMQQSFPHIHSFPVTEAKPSVMLQLLALKDLGNLHDGRSDTTLISEKTPLSRNLGSALVVSMIQGGKPVLVKQNANPKASKGTPLWDENHPHKAFGAQTDNTSQISQRIVMPAIHSGIIAENESRLVQQWVRAQADQAINPGYVDAFQSPVIEHEQPSAYTSSEAPRNTEPSKPMMKRSRVVRGARQAGSADKAENRSPSTGVSRQVPTEGTQQADYLLGILEIEPPIMPSLLSPVPSVTIPDATTTTSATSPTASTSGSRGWQQRSTQEVRSGLLIDIEGNLQTSSVVTRDFRRTMGHRKPQKHISPSHNEMLKNFEKAATRLLHLALPQQGPIGFEVNIGRLLIDPETSSPELKQPFPLSQWPCGLPNTKENGIARETVFTPRLTTRSRDIQSILSIKQSQGRPMFKEEPQKREVTYTIFCKTKNGEQLTIEVDDDGSFKCKGSNFLVGAVDWHYPLRTWDSRLQISAQEWGFNDYHRQAQGIVDNMKVQMPADEQEIQFSTTTIDETLSIEAVLLHRKTTHSVTVYPDLLLHLTEVQDLSVQKLSGADRQYEGFIYQPAEMIAAGKFWWESSITSSHAATVLKENATLEFGEVAKWSPENIIGKGVIKDMYGLAKEIITNIDDVGFHNNKAHRSNYDLTVVTKTRTSQRTGDAEGPPGMRKYW